MGRNPRIKVKTTADDEVDTKKVMYAIVTSIFLLMLILLNYFKVDEMLNSNSTLINEFEKPKEEIVREPAVAGLFYSEDREQLDKDVEHYLTISKDETTKKPKMLIVPHAGYKYSGGVAGKAYAMLKPYANTIKKVVIVGPSHHEYLKGIAITNHDSFKTPLGKINIDKNLEKELVDKNSFIKVSNSAHVKEHSIEVQLPFLQKVLNDFTIVPLAYGSVEPEQIAEALRPLLGREDTVIIFSADLSHYYSYDHAKSLDEHTSSMISGNDADLDDDASCGATGINAALILSKDKKFYPETLELKNSGDITGDKSRVVGYGAWSFGDNQEELVGIEKELSNIKDFANLYKNELIEIVQISLEDAVDGKVFKPSRKDYPEDVFDKGASFVTLKKGGELRGCIGTIIPEEAVAVDVAKAAYDAAMQDKRFDKLTREELKDLDFSISLLTGLERIRFISEEDLISKIQENKDGLVMVDGSRRGLFLPSVWEEVKDRKDFLQHLKIKTGLSPAYWSNKIIMYRFHTVEIKKNEN